MTPPSEKKTTKTITFHFSKAVFTLKNYRCLTELRSSEAYRQSLGIAKKKKKDTVKTEPRFNYIVLRIQRVMDKQCLSRCDGSLKAVHLDLCCMQIQIVSCFGTSCVEVNNSMYGIKVPVDLYVFFFFFFFFL